jgi:hypothetical protein
MVRSLAVTAVVTSLVVCCFISPEKIDRDRRWWSMLPSPKDVRPLWYGTYHTTILRDRCAAQCLNFMSRGRVSLRQSKIWFPKSVHVGWWSCLLPKFGSVSNVLRSASRRYIWLLDPPIFAPCCNLCGYGSNLLLLSVCPCKSVGYECGTLLTSSVHLLYALHLRMQRMQAAVTWGILPQRKCVWGGGVIVREMLYKLPHIQPVNAWWLMPSQSGPILQGGRRCWTDKAWERAEQDLWDHVFYVLLTTSACLSSIYRSDGNWWSERRRT